MARESTEWRAVQTKPLTMKVVYPSSLRNNFNAALPLAQVFLQLLALLVTVSMVEPAVSRVGWLDTTGAGASPKHL